MASAAELNTKHGIAGVAEVVDGNGGLAKVAVTTSAASGEMYLQGGTVTSWKPAGADEVIFVSSKTKWDPACAIRGGVPVCFPWFGAKTGAQAGDKSAPAHGFVRARAWQLESIARRGELVVVNMFIENDEGTRKLWPASFRLTQRATFGAEMGMELVMTNSGDVPLRYEAALHTYFRVGDVNQVRVRGLDGVHYIDKVDSNRVKPQSGEVVITGETDRVYLNTAGTVELEDPAMRRRIHIAKENSLATVVWNPWAAKAKAMSDLGDDEWQRFVCVETCNVGDYAVTLSPSAQHSMKVIYSLALV